MKRSGILGKCAVLTDSWKRFGALAAAEVSALWVLRQMAGYREATVYRLDLDRLAISEDNGIEWGYRPPHEIDPETLGAAGLDFPSLQSAVAGGERCFVGLSGGRVCYISVVSTAGFSVPERLTAVFTGDSEAYVGNCFTIDEFRGRGIYPRALVQLGARLRTEGIERLYLFVERDNLASIRSVTKAGFHAVATCRTIRWRQIPRPCWRSLAPLPHCRMSVITARTP